MTLSMARSVSRLYRPSRIDDRTVLEREVTGAATWPRRLDAGRSSGSSSLAPCGNCAFGQRGWNRHPEGGSIGDGTSPSRMIRFFARPRVRVRDRHRREQRAGVRVLRVRGRGSRPAAISTILPEVHHGDAVRDVLHDRQVVRDEQVGEVELLLQVLEQVEDLGLDRDVERRDRLVAHDQLGPQGERRARPRSAGAGRRRTRAGSGCSARGSGPTSSISCWTSVLILFFGTVAVEAERGADDRADRLARVQRRVRVLEDHLHLAAERPQLAAP